jgi:hypothetical protein
MELSCKYLISIGKGRSIISPSDSVTFLPFLAQQLLYTILHRKVWPTYWGERLAGKKTVPPLHRRKGRASSRGKVKRHKILKKKEVRGHK